MTHVCEADLVCKSTNERVPYFNVRGSPTPAFSFFFFFNVCSVQAPVFLENKEQIGKVDDIFGKMLERVRMGAILFFYS